MVGVCCCVVQYICAASSATQYADMEREEKGGGIGAWLPAECVGRKREGKGYFSSVSFGLAMGKYLERGLQIDTMRPKVLGYLEAKNMWVFSYSGLPHLAKFAKMVFALLLTLVASSILLLSPFKCPPSVHCQSIIFHLFAPFQPPPPPPSLNGLGCAEMSRQNKQLLLSLHCERKKGKDEDKKRQAELLYNIAPLLAQ